MSLSEALSFFAPPSHEWSLEGLTDLLDRLGLPHHRLPPVIHIAGTNGKGSTTAFLSSCLQAAGLRVHRFISPHLVSWTERLMVANHPISEEALIHYLQICARYQDKPVSPFEAVTASAFLAFAEHPAEVVLMEVGLGGRLDATNVLPSTPPPGYKGVCASVLTPISLDHQDLLGHTLEKIATEKCGILRPHVPCISAPQPLPAVRTIQEKAKAAGAPLFQGGQVWNYSPFDVGARAPGLKVDLWDGSCKTYPQLGLVGDHQLVNAATAVATLHAQAALSVPEEAITQGLAQASWPGRLHQVTHGPFKMAFPEGSEIWIDGAHNEGGAEALRHHIQTYWKNKPSDPSSQGAPPELPLILVIGMLRRKDSQNFWEILAPCAQEAWIIEHFGDHEVTPASVFETYCPKVPLHAFKTLEEVFSACPLKAPARLLFCGSLYFMGELLRL